jgi:hypothetical protein
MQPAESTVQLLCDIKGLLLIPNFSPKDCWEIINAINVELEQNATGKMERMHGWSGIDPRGMSFLEVVKRYPEQVIKVLKQHAKENNEAESLINRIDAVVESPDNPSNNKIECIKFMLLDWYKRKIDNDSIHMFRG